MSNLFDFKFSLGSVCNIIQSVIPTAKNIHENQDLSNIKLYAQDEMFQLIIFIYQRFNGSKAILQKPLKKQHFSPYSDGTKMNELADMACAVKQEKKVAQAKEEEIKFR